MQVTINDASFDIPFEPELITVSEFLEWHALHGKRLNGELKSILENKDLEEVERLSQIEDYLDREALWWFSFWTETDYDDVKNHPDINPYLDNYRLLRTLLNDNDFKYPYEVEWQGHVWRIEDFKLNPASEMSFNEIITSKEIMRQVYKIGEDNWTGLPYLCAVYFRKLILKKTPVMEDVEIEKEIIYKGMMKFFSKIFRFKKTKKEVVSIKTGEKTSIVVEPFKDELVMHNSERLNLFKELPLSHALAVAFFLNVCVNIWSNTLAYSAEKAPEQVSQA